MNKIPEPPRPPQPPSTFDGIEVTDRAWTYGYTFMAFIFGAIFILFVAHSLIVTP